jgi:CysZ protein
LLKELIISVRAFFLAHNFIMQHRLWRWMILPGIIYAFLFILGISYFSQTSSTFIEWIILKTGLKSWVDTIDSDIIGFFITMGSFWLWFTLMLFYFAMFKFIFLILFSPIFSYHHLRIAAIQQNVPYLFNWPEYIKLMIRAIKLSLTNMVWQIVYLIPIILFCTIPIIGWFTPIFTILMEGYYFGYAMMDYGLATENKSSIASATYVSNHKGLPIANGLMFYIMHLIPVIGWVTAPFYALIAAHLNTQEIKDNA